MKAEKVSVGLEMDHVYSIEGMPPIVVNKTSQGSQLARPYKATVKVVDGRWKVALVDAHRMLTSGDGPRVTLVFVPQEEGLPDWVRKLAEMSEMDTPIVDSHDFGIGEDYLDTEDDLEPRTGREWNRGHWVEVPEGDDDNT